MTPFHGHPAFLADAARELGLPSGTTDDARRQPAISQIASLVSQAGSDPHPDTLRRINELTDGLLVAALAAIRMRQLVDASPLTTVVMRNEPAKSKRTLVETPA